MFKKHNIFQPHEKKNFNTLGSFEAIEVALKLDFFLQDLLLKLPAVSFYVLWKLKLFSFMSQFWID